MSTSPNPRAQAALADLYSASEEDLSRNFITKAEFDRGIEKLDTKQEIKDLSVKLDELAVEFQGLRVMINTMTATLERIEKQTSKQS